MSAPVAEQTGAFTPTFEDTMLGYGSASEARSYPVTTDAETGRPEDILPGVSPLEAAQAAQTALAEAHGLHRDSGQPSGEVLAVDNKLRLMAGHYMDRITSGLPMYRDPEHSFAPPEVRVAPTFTSSEQEIVYAAVQKQLPAPGEPRLPKEQDDRLEAAAVLTWLHAAPEEQ